MLCRLAVFREKWAVGGGGEPAPELVGCGGYGAPLAEIEPPPRELHKTRRSPGYDQRSAAYARKTRASRFSMETSGKGLGGGPDTTSAPFAGSYTPP